MSNQLSISYNESIGKIVGCDDTKLRIFKIPTNVKAKRKKFWDEFFCKYNRNEMEESNDELHNCVQFWVNTGYMPYNRLKSNTHVHSSSCSTLDTATNILSNADTTTKTGTMAIVEGAKYDIVNYQRTKDMEVTPVVTNEMYVREHKDSTLNDNDNHSEQYSEQTCEMPNCLLQPNDTNAEQNVTLGTKTDVHTLPEVGNMDLGTRYRKKLYTGRDSPIDLINMRSSNKSKIFQLRKDLHPALDLEYKSKLSKKKKRKRIGRINQNFTLHKNWINNDSLNILSSHKHIQRKKKPDFNKIFKMVLDTTEAVDTPPVNNNAKKNLVKNGILVEYNSDCCLNTSLPIAESIDAVTATDEFTVNHTFNKSTDHLEGELKSVIRKSTNVNPVVRLVRLSEDVIARYLGSKKAMEILNTADITGSSKFSNEYRNLKKSIRNKKEIESKNYLDSTINTSIPNIQKYKKPSHVGMNLNPVVYIERLCGESRIQKYKKSTHIKTNFDNFNPVVVLKRLSKSDIYKYKCVNNKKVTNESDLICKKMHLQNNNMNTLELTKSSKSNNLSSTLSAMSLRYNKPILPKNILHDTRNCNTLWVEDSSVSSVSESFMCSTQSCSPTVKVSNKHTFKREKKVTGKGHKLNRRVTNKVIRSTGRNSNYVTGEESAKTSSNSRVATLFPWYQSDEDGEDYEKFIISLNKLDMPTFEAFAS